MVEDVDWWVMGVIVVAGVEVAVAAKRNDPERGLFSRL